MEIKMVFIYFETDDNKNSYFSHLNVNLDLYIDIYLLCENDNYNVFIAELKYCIRTLVSLKINK